MKRRDWCRGPGHRDGRPGDASVVFAGSVEVPARVVAIHPTANLALIRYEPEDIGGPGHRDPLQEVDLEAGDTLKHVGLSPRLGLAEAKVKVKSTVGSPCLFRACRFFGRLTSLSWRHSRGGFVGGASRSVVIARRFCRVIPESGR